MQSKIKPYRTYQDFRVIDIHFDSRNRAWVSTHDGIFIITLKKNKFNTLLSGHSARGIVEDNQGIIHVNTYDGRMLVNYRKGEVKNHKDILVSLWLSATKDRDNTLWFGAQYPMIEKYEPLNRQSHYYKYHTDTTSMNIPWEQWAIIRDHTGQIWTGTRKGLYCLEPETGNYWKFDQYNNFSLLEESTIYHLYEDEKGIWIASSTGLYLLEFGKGITARYASDEKSPDYIPYDHILHFYRDQTGGFWLATKGGGLIRFDPKTGESRQFTTADGLSNNIIYAVYEDAYGKLWLPSNYGLMQFDKETHQVNTYLEGDGIAHNEFNTGSHYQDSNGRLYFGGLAGVTTLDPKGFSREDTIAVPLRITNCSVLNGETGELTDKTVAVSTTGELVLSPTDRSFILQFALLNYENTRQNSYSYKIEGLDNVWSTLQENNLRVNGLPYGNYVLRIKGQGINGQWSSHELTIPILVNRPFYKETWFILTSIFALLLLTYVLFRWRLQRLKQAKIQLEKTVEERTVEISRQKNKIAKQAEKLQELDKVKSRFFANISHELRTPLTLILGPLDSLITSLKSNGKANPKEIVKPLDVMQRNGKQLLHLIEEILDLSKLEAGKLEVKESPVAFYGFVKRLFSGFESHAAQHGIDYQLYYGLPEDIQLLLDSNKSEKIINNLLSNAFKYSADGTSVSLKVSEESSLICIEVKDSGQGIHPDDLPRIFDRFYQSRQPDAKTQGGTGHWPGVLQRTGSSDGRGNSCEK